MKIPPEHKAQLVAIAAELGISLDEVVEQAIAQFLEEYSKAQVSSYVARVSKACDEIFLDAMTERLNGTDAN